MSTFCGFLAFQVFIRKFEALEKQYGNEKDFKELFIATVDALELDGIYLRTLDKDAATERYSAPPVVQESKITEESEEQLKQPFSFKELFKEKQPTNDVPSDKS